MYNKCINSTCRYTCTMYNKCINIHVVDTHLHVQ